MPDEEKKPEMAVCPCCGQQTLKKPVKVDGKIVDDYLASIMTGVPFSHTFSLFDGRLLITTAMADRDNGLKLYKFIFLVEPFSQESTSVQDLLGLVNTYCTIKQIEIVGPDDRINKLYYPAERIYAACGKLLEEWDHVNLNDEEKKKEFLEAVGKVYDELKPTEVISSTPPKVLTRIVNDFRALETIMLEAGFDENFWKGIELA